jgi:hypothetical protein
MKLLCAHKSNIGWEEWKAVLTGSLHCCDELQHRLDAEGCHSCMTKLFAERNSAAT